MATPEGYRTGPLTEETRRSDDQTLVTDERAAGEDEKLQHTKSSKSYRSEDPFGDETNAEVKYKVLEWWQAGMIMIAETISLGILSLPSVLAAIGIVPGMILILGLGIVATYTGYVIGQFKLAHPFVHNMADAGEVLMGRFGREFLGAAQILLLVFLMGSHILTFTIMLNTLSSHGACTIVFGIVGLIVCYICTLPRKLGDVSYLAIASFISILSAVIVTMADVGTQRPGDGQIAATMQQSLAGAFLPVTNIVFAYAGHVAFFSFISELKRPEEYYKSLFLLQGANTSMYLLVAAVIYAYAGKDVASPALGSSSPLFQKIAYGLAIPTIVVAGVINGHVAAKYIYVRMYRGTDMMSRKSIKSYGMWALITLGLWVAAWIIAEAIPEFNDLLGLISSLFSSWFTYGLSGVFWLHLNRGRWFESKRKIALTVLNTIIVLIGGLIMVLGLYASGEGIAKDASSGTGSFSCQDNSKSSA